MKYNYETIEKNLEVFKQAKKEFPVIQQYINGEVSSDALSRIGLQSFSSFYDFIKLSESMNTDIINKNMTWRKLKPILINNTKSEKYKKYISNRTEKEFIKILTDGATGKLDSLMNGRWVKKPGRRRSGRRSDEKVDAIKLCSPSILNYVIKNEIDCDLSNINNIHWYSYQKLSLDGLCKREIEVTDKMIKSITETLNTSSVDFRKLNIDYINTSIYDTLKRLMVISPNSTLKCIKGIHGRITEGKIYTSNECTIRNGYLSVKVITDSGYQDYIGYSHFEDLSSLRQDTLSMILGES